MYTTKDTMIPLNFSDIGIKPIGMNINAIADSEQLNPYLVDYGNSLYLSKDCGYKNFNTTIQSFHYYKNLISHRTQSNITCLYFEGIMNQLQSEDCLKILSTYTLNSIYGNKVNSSHVKFDNVEQLITTDVEKSFYTYIPGMPISLDTPTFRSTHLIYIDRALGVVPLMPKLERIVYPLNSYHYINIKEQIEKGLEYNLKIFNQLSVYNAITFYRPMYLYSTDKISWKKLQTTISSPTYNEFVNVDFHNNYDEFITGGNTYEEMITIPASKWTELIGDDLHASCWVLCNSYVPVIEVSHKTSEIDDTGEFLSIYDRIGRIVIQKCSI